MRFFSLKNKLFVLVLLGVAALSLNVFQEGARNGSLNVFRPVQSALWSMGNGVSGFFSSLFGQGFQKENEELRAENLKLSQELVAQASMQQENEQLRVALRLGVDKEFSVLLAQAFAKDASQDVLFLNKGTRDGVQKGMAVMTSHKAAAGKITEVFEDSSKLLLISHPKSSFDAKIEGKGIAGVVKGQGRYQAALDVIPPEIEVLAGDMVATASIGGIFPKDLLVGKVREVRASDLEAFQQATLDLSFSLNDTELLFIILGHK